METTFIVPQDKDGTDVYSRNEDGTDVLYINPQKRWK